MMDIEFCMSVAYSFNNIGFEVSKITTFSPRNSEVIKVRRYRLSVMFLCVVSA